MGPLLFHGTGTTKINFSNVDYLAVNVVFEYLGKIEAALENTGTSSCQSVRGPDELRYIGKNIGWYKSRDTAPLRRHWNNWIGIPVYFRNTGKVGR